MHSQFLSTRHQLPTSTAMVLLTLGALWGVTTSVVAQNTTPQRGERDLESYLRQGLRPVDPLPVTTPPRYQHMLSEGQRGAAPQRPVPPTAEARPRDSRAEAGVPQALNSYEVARQRYVQRMMEAQAEMQYWNTVTGYGLNGVVPLDAPYRFYVGNTPLGFPATYLNSFEQWPAFDSSGLPYPPTVYFNTAPGTHPTGFETIVTGPDSYIYRPFYGQPAQDQMAPPQPSFRSGRAAQGETSIPVIVDPSAPEVVRAVRFFQERRYRDALALLDRAIATNIDDGSLELLRAQTLFARGDYARAAESLQDALTTLPVEQWGLIATDPAAFYLEPQQYALQTAALRGYVRQNPGNVAARLLLGYHLGFQGDPQLAAEELQRLDEQGAGSAVSDELRQLFQAAAQQRAAEQATTEPEPETTSADDQDPSNQPFPRRGGREF